MNKTKGFGNSLEEGLKYPWNKASRLWNILWVLIPILGWLALLGYIKKIAYELAKGLRKELPEFNGFWNNFTSGAKTLIFVIPTILVLAFLNMIPLVGKIAYLLALLFLMPWLVINFFVKGNFGSLWELKRAFNCVFDNAKEYVITMAKTIIYALVYGLLGFILIGMPCYAFGMPYFMTEFYQEHH